MDCIIRWVAIILCIHILNFHSLTVDSNLIKCTCYAVQFFTKSIVVVKMHCKIFERN